MTVFSMALLVLQIMVCSIQSVFCAATCSQMRIWNHQSSMSISATEMAAEMQGITLRNYESKELNLIVYVWRYPKAICCWHQDQSSKDFFASGWVNWRAKLLSTNSNSPVSEEQGSWRKFLFCHSPKTTSQAKDLFHMMNNFFTKQQFHLDRIGLICTDGASTMLSNCSRFAALLGKEIPNLRFTHCFLIGTLLQQKHCPQTWGKLWKLVWKLWTWFVSVLWIIDCFNRFVRKWVRNKPCFCIILKEGGCHVFVCYLVCLNCGMKFSSFSVSSTWTGCLAGYFDESEFIQALAYLADVFTTLNELNRFPQGRGISILDACEELSAFKNKLLLWIRRIKKENLVYFPSLEETLTEDASLHPDFALKIVEHLQLLCTLFDDYLSCEELQTCNHWIRALSGWIYKILVMTAILHKISLIWKTTV